jgi:hypothetical protein
VSRRRDLLLAAAAAAALAGCGKSAQDTYVSKLNAMCEDFAAREQQIGEPASPEDLAARGDRIVAAFDETILVPLRELEAPPELSSQAARLRILTRLQHDTLRALAAAGKTGDLEQVQRLVVRNSQLNAQAGQLAAGLHADSCGSPSG